MKAGAMSVSDAQREATVANGTWRGAWHDTAGHSGTSDVTIAIKGTTRMARASVAFAGPLLGTAVPTQAYDVDLRSFVLLADTWTVDSPQFGTVTVVPDGFRYGSGSAKNVLGHPEIASINVQAIKIGRRVDIAYTVKHTTGTSVEGTMAWSASGARAVPKPLHYSQTRPDPATPTRAPVTGLHTRRSPLATDRGRDRSVDSLNATCDRYPLCAAAAAPWAQLSHLAPKQPRSNDRC